ncbi:MAG: NADH-quinone oxidoreductase subunit G [Gammaproteobacteria bacterium]|nr:NADH-quinone oxidoreductase subunit G [Gammaproteobacteria bacterium]
MSDDQVTIEVDGKEVQARKGQMLIEVTDQTDAYVPRFCYHQKLSIAANCRMCLVEVERAPKPLPACATPVAEGMKVFTRSPAAIAAQKATMEFLLINHPLDCPICDQGGECELQDQAIGYGRGISRYTERKRVVKDEDIGPLVSTDMTRCIHCTRCVRFGEEIAGIQELGTTGRGENNRIGTYVARSVNHELSGNIIDLCPVGALNSKPFRYRARGWEMTQTPLVSPHDAVGSNLYGHVRRGELMRVVPRLCEDINETWISDRDRFSYPAVYSEDRLKTPMIRRDDEWQSCDWETALQAVVDGVRQAIGTAENAVPERLGMLASESATLEEMYLLRRLADAIGTANLDHRLRRRDFEDQANDPLYPGLGIDIAEIDSLPGMMIVGSDLRREAPILAHRVRKAALEGALVSFVNPEAYEYFFDVAAYAETGKDGLLRGFAAVVRALADEKGEALSASIRTLADAATPEAVHRDTARSLIARAGQVILLGCLALEHPAFSELRLLAAEAARLSGARIAYLPRGANSAGAAIAGVLPHRGEAGRVREHPGMNVEQMLERPRNAYLLFGIEPEHDMAHAAKATEAFGQAEFVAVATPFDSPAAREYAHVLLPIGTFAETAGTFINAEGRWQSFVGAAVPVGEARPGWKVLRVLGNLMNLDGFEYESASQILDEVHDRVGEAELDTSYGGDFSAREDASAKRDSVASTPGMYSGDALVRRSRPLQLTKEGQAAA